MAILDLQDAIDSIDRGQATEAIPLLQQVSKQTPTYVVVHALLARAYEAEGQWVDAQAAWQQAFFLMPNSPVVREGIERTLAALKAEPVLAGDDMLIDLELDPDEDISIEALTSLFEVEEILEQDEEEAVLAFAEEAVEEVEGVVEVEDEPFVEAEAESSGQEGVVETVEEDATLEADEVDAFAVEDSVQEDVEAVGEIDLVEGEIADEMGEEDDDATVVLSIPDVLEAVAEEYAEPEGEEPGAEMETEPFLQEVEDEEEAPAQEAVDEHTEALAESAIAAALLDEIDEKVAVEPGEDDAAEEVLPEILDDAEPEAEVVVALDDDEVFTPEEDGDAEAEVDAVEVDESLSSDEELVAEPVIEVEAEVDEESVAVAEEEEGEDAIDKEEDVLEESEAIIDLVPDDEEEVEAIDVLDETEEALSTEEDVAEEELVLEVDSEDDTTKEEEEDETFELFETAQVDIPDVSEDEISLEEALVIDDLDGPEGAEDVEPSLEDIEAIVQAAMAAAKAEALEGDQYELQTVEERTLEVTDVVSDMEDTEVVSDSEVAPDDGVALYEEEEEIDQEAITLYEEIDRLIDESDEDEEGDDTTLVEEAPQEEIVGEKEEMGFDLWGEFEQEVEGAPKSSTLEDFEDLDRLIDELETARIVPRPDLDAVPQMDLEDNIEDMVSETLALIYINQNQYDEAARVYEQLATQQPDQADEFLQKAAEARAQGSGA